MKDTVKHGSKGALVRELQTMLNTVGANITTDGDFGDTTFDVVCDFQTWKKLEPDGVVGPKTWYALEQAVLHHEIRTKALDADKLALAGRRAIERATALWHTDVYDPAHDDFSDDATRCKTVIDKMIRSPLGLGWAWEGAYKGDGDFQWCGAFAAFCWPEVKEQLRLTYFASTLRLDRYASYRSFQGEPNTGSGRVYVKLDENSKPEDATMARAGDILIIGPSRVGPMPSWKAYGNHICLVESYDAFSGVFHTLEGNGNGLGPHGERQHGVVKGIRHVGGPGWVARRLIRPSEADLA